MLIIVTEDTGLGNKLVRLMAKAVYGDGVEVFSSAYGNKKSKVGGFERLPVALECLIKDGKIHGEFDRVIVVYDDKSDRYEDSYKSIQDIFDVTTVLEGCTKVLNEAKVKFRINGCTCFEEAVFSFKYLSQFCDPLGNNTTNTDSGRVYNEIYSQFYGDGITKRDKDKQFTRLAGDYYRQLFKKLGWPFDSDTKTIEDSIKTSLTKYMIKADFSNFAIKPGGSYLGQCWRLGCSKAKSSEACSACLVKGMRGLLSNPSSVRERLILFYKHSIFSSLF